MRTVGRVAALAMVCLGAGGVFTPVLAQKTAPAVTRDSDRDGVPDTRDRCRNTPAATRVDATGCPAPASAAAPPAAGPAAAAGAAGVAAAHPRTDSAHAAPVDGQSQRPPATTGPPGGAAPAAAGAAAPASAPAPTPAPAAPATQSSAAGAPPAGAVTAAPAAGAASQQAAGPPPSAHPAGLPTPSVSAPNAPSPSPAAGAAAAGAPAAPTPAQRPAAPAAAAVTPAAPVAAAPAADPTLTAGFAMPGFEGATEAEALEYARMMALRLDSAAVSLYELFRNTSGAPMAGATGPNMLSTREKNRWRRCRLIQFDLGTFGDAAAVLRDTLTAARLQRSALNLADAFEAMTATAECDNLVSMVEAPDRFAPWQQSYEQSARTFYRDWYTQLKAVHDADRSFALALNAQLPTARQFPIFPTLGPNPTLGGGR
jgi:hypothetical protein